MAARVRCAEDGFNPIKEGAMQTIIIEVSGGVVQNVYTDAGNVNIVLVNWDKGESPGDDYESGKLEPQRISEMARETSAAVSGLLR
jgi:hypothetical protein